MNCEARERAAKLDALEAVLDANKEAAYLAQQAFISGNQMVKCSSVGRMAIYLQRFIMNVFDSLNIAGEAKPRAPLRPRPVKKFPEI